MIEIKHKKTRAVVFRHAGELAGAALRRADLRHGRLRNAELMGSDLSHAALCHADLKGATLMDARLDRADLTGANLEKSNLRGASFRGARMAHARLPRDIYSADFTGADLKGFHGLRGDPSKGNGFRNCKFDGADFRGTDLRGLAFADCSFNGADLRGARMNGTHHSSVLSLSVLALVPEAVQEFIKIAGANAPSTSLLHPSGGAWGLLWWALGLSVVLLQLYCGLAQPAASFEHCDFNGALHDETTRWPKGRIPPTPRGKRASASNARDAV